MQAAETARKAVVAPFQAPAGIGFDHISHHSSKRPKAEWTNRVSFMVNGSEAALLAGIALIAWKLGVFGPAAAGGDGGDGITQTMPPVPVGNGGLGAGPGGVTPEAGPAHGGTTGPTATGEGPTGQTKTASQWQRTLVIARINYGKESDPQKKEGWRQLWHEAWVALQTWPSLANKYPDAPPPPMTDTSGTATGTGTGPGAGPGSGPGTGGYPSGAPSHGGGPGGRIV